MNIVAPISPVVIKPGFVSAPIAAPAAVAAQATTAPVAKTQTAQAAAAVGKTDNSRDGQNSTKTGQALDTLANANTALANRAAAGRGSLIDVRV